MLLSQQIKKILKYLVNVVTRVDDRFIVIERRVDERLERHELRIDKTIRQMSTDSTDRSDIMLQLFEQRLDQFRIELKNLQKKLKVAPLSEPGNTEPIGVQNIDSTKQENIEVIKPVHSFRKLANAAIANGTESKPASSEPGLYDKILSFKEDVANRHISFSDYDKEIIDYILSFQDKSKDLEYMQVHTRRFLATLKRIPHATNNNDKLLELGSLSHLLPAIKKYCGYQDIYGADLLESGEKKLQRTLKQLNHSGNAESYTYEVSNFNVESDIFPYSDGTFNIILCCELIEHLKKDPMHMLWECNRVLKDDGYLLLTTPNIASYRALEAMLVHCPPYLLPQYNVSDPLDQHYREFAPNEIQMALEASGFTVAELDTEDVWTTPNPAIIEMLIAQHITTRLRGDNIFVIARKSSAPKERYPKDLYRGF